MRSEEEYSCRASKRNSYIQMRGRVRENGREEEKHKQCKRLITTHIVLGMYKRVSETIADELFFYTSFNMIHKLKMGHLFLLKSLHRITALEIRGKRRPTFNNDVLPVKKSFKNEEEIIILNQWCIDCAIFKIHKLRNSQREASLPESIELKEGAGSGGEVYIHSSTFEQK